MAVITRLTALLLSSLNDLEFCFDTLFQSFRAQSIIGKCTSRHMFPHGGLKHRLGLESARAALCK